MDHERIVNKQTELSETQRGYLSLKDVPFAGKNEKDFGIDNLAEKIKSPEPDKLAKYLMRSFLQIDKEEFNRPIDAKDILYKNIRYDEDSAGEIINNAKTKEEWSTFMTKVRSDCQATGKYERIANTQPGFLHFKSWNIYGGERIPSEEQVHRIYINSKASNLMNLVSTLYEQLKEDKTPFYFKIHKATEAEKGPRDSLVLYTSTKYLRKTIDAFEKIEHDHPDIIKNLNNPSELVGRIDKEWMGYASENAENPRNSYTGFMCESFIDTAEESLSKWIKGHPDTLVPGGKTVKAYWEEINLSTQPDMYESYQYLLKSIPKIDKTFVSSFCDGYKQNLIKKGFNPNNIALTPYAEKNVKDYAQSLSKIKQN